MININLVKNNVPIRIDLPRRKKSHRFLTYWFLSAVCSIFIITVIVYSVYKKETNTAKKVSNKQEVTVEHKVTALHNKVSVDKKVSLKKIQHQAKTRNMKIIKRIEKHDMPVFSLNIQLEDIPEPDNKKTVADREKLPSINVSLAGSKADLEKQHLDKKTMLFVKVETDKFTKLKSMLKDMNIKYSAKRIVYKKSYRYDIFVGGFDSYSSTVKFSRDLRTRGYNIYKIVNLNLLFYVCIDKGVNEKRKMRYIDVWSKTPFKIITKRHGKVYYRYRFIFNAMQKDINLLKKDGYYPIILPQTKNGA